MVNDTQNINRANGMQRTIRLILCKNNPNAGIDPDAKENNDKNINAAPARSVKLEEVRREMVNVMDLLENMKRVVENIDNFAAKNKFRKAMAAFEIARQDILDETQFKINERDPGAGRPAMEKNINAFLTAGGDGMIDLQKWA